MCGRYQIQVGGENSAMTVNWTKAQRKAAHTARWAVTMTKVRIRQALARTRWQLVTFCGVSGAESVGVVDLMAIRKDIVRQLVKARASIDQQFDAHQCKREDTSRAATRIVRQATENKKT